MNDVLSVLLQSIKLTDFISMMVASVTTLLNAFITAASLLLTFNLTVRWLSEAQISITFGMVNICTAAVCAVSGDEQVTIIALTLLSIGILRKVLASEAFFCFQCRDFLRFEKGPNPNPNLEYRTNQSPLLRWLQRNI